MTPVKRTYILATVARDHDGWQLQFATSLVSPEYRGTLVVDCAEDPDTIDVLRQMLGRTVTITIEAG